MSKFWLYFGIFLTCSGIGTGLGILLVIFYFWDDIKTCLNNIQNTDVSESVSMSHYDDKTLKELQ
jgi:hypothetical protein